MKLCKFCNKEIPEDDYETHGRQCQLRMKSLAEKFHPAQHGRACKYCGKLMPIGEYISHSRYCRAAPRVLPQPPLISSEPLTVTLVWGIFLYADKGDKAVGLRYGVWDEMKKVKDDCAYVPVEKTSTVFSEKIVAQYNRQPVCWSKIVVCEGDCENKLEQEFERVRLKAEQTTTMLDQQNLRLKIYLCGHGDNGSQHISGTPAHTVGAVVLKYFNLFGSSKRIRDPLHNSITMDVCLGGLAQQGEDSNAWVIGSMLSKAKIPCLISCVKYLYGVGLGGERSGGVKIGKQSFNVGHDGSKLFNVVDKLNSDALYQPPMKEYLCVFPSGHMSWVNKQDLSVTKNKEEALLLDSIIDLTSHIDLNGYLYEMVGAPSAATNLLELSFSGKINASLELLLKFFPYYPLLDYRQFIVLYNKYLYMENSFAYDEPYEKLIKGFYDRLLYWAGRCPEGGAVLCVLRQKANLLPPLLNKEAPSLDSHTFALNLDSLINDWDD
jgi:hypothetical protein